MGEHEHDEHEEDDDLHSHADVHVADLRLVLDHLQETHKETVSSAMLKARSVMGLVKLPVRA